MASCLLGVLWGGGERAIGGGGKVTGEGGWCWVGCLPAVGTDARLACGCGHGSFDVVVEGKGGGGGGRKERRRWTERAFLRVIHTHVHAQQLIQPLYLSAFEQTQRLFPQRRKRNGAPSLKNGRQPCNFRLLHVFSFPSIILIRLFFLSGDGLGCMHFSDIFC